LTQQLHLSLESARAKRHTFWMLAAALQAELDLVEGDARKQLLLNVFQVLPHSREKG
jgi:hypothetical protein